MSWSIEIPKVDANVTRALVVKWLVREGDAVTAGTALVEIETEKAVFEIEAAESGVVLRIDVPEGERAPVGAVLGVIGEPQSAVSPAPTSVACVSRGSGEVTGISPEYIVDDYGDALLGESLAPD